MDLGRAGATLGLRPDDTVEQARRRYRELTGQQAAGPAATPTSPSSASVSDLDQALLAYVLAEPAAAADPHTSPGLRRVGIAVAALGVLAVLVTVGLPLLRSALLQRASLGAPVPSAVAGVAVPPEARQCPFTDKDTDVRRPGRSETRYCLPGAVAVTTLRRWYAQHQPVDLAWPGWLTCGGTRYVTGAEQALWASPDGERRGYVVPSVKSPVAFIVAFDGPDGGCS